MSVLAVKPDNPALVRSERLKEKWLAEQMKLLSEQGHKTFVFHFDGDPRIIADTRHPKSKKRIK